MPRNLAERNSGSTARRMSIRIAMVRPGKQPTVPSTLMAGSEYSPRTASSQSAHLVSTERCG